MSIKQDKTKRKEQWDEEYWSKFCEGCAQCFDRHGIKDERQLRFPHKSKLKFCVDCHDHHDRKCTRGIQLDECDFCSNKHREEKRKGWE